MMGLFDFFKMFEQSKIESKYNELMEKAYNSLIQDDDISQLSDEEKVRNIISSHKITDNDCKEILKLMDNDWSRLISLYYGQLESVETDNIGELIISLLKK